MFVCVFACVCVSAMRLLITSCMMWHDMDPMRLVKQVLQLLALVHVIDTNPLRVS